MHVWLFSPQQKLQEIERVEKWLKMVKKWDKYRNSDKVFTELAYTNLLSQFRPRFPFEELPYAVLFPSL